MINAFGVSGLVTGFTAAMLGLFVYIKNPNRRLYRYWLLFSIAVAVWGFGGTAISYAQDPDTALWLWRYSFALGVIWIPAFFLGFVCDFCGITKRNALINAVYVINFVFALSSFSPIFLSSTRYSFDQFYYGVPGSPLFLIHFIWWCLVFSSSLVMLIRKIRIADPYKRRQIQYTFFGIGSGAVGGTLNFLPFFNIDIYPWGNFAIPVYTALLTYAIVRHQLMEIQVAIRRATVFAGLYAFIFGVFLIFTVIGQKYFQTILHWPDWVAMIPSILIITLTLRPLDRFLTQITDKYLFQKEYDFRELMKLFTTEVLTIFELDKVTKNTVDSLNNLIKLESCAVFLKNNNDEYRITASVGVKDTAIMFKSDAPIIYNLKHKQGYVQRDPDINTDQNTLLLNRDLEMIGSELCVAISFTGELIGFISLGQKKSGDLYEQEDIDLLVSLARTESIAISNAKLFAKLSETQAEAAQNEKMAVIGTLAAGINHEICNPLGIVRGQSEMFLLNYRDGIYGQLESKEVLEQAVTIFGKIIKETDRATGITKRLSTFAKPNKHFQISEVDVAREVDEVLAILDHEMKLENINIAVDLPKSFPKIMADRKELQEVIFNIVRNAAQAIAGSGKIVIGGHRNGTRAMITITDNGHGIPSDKMEKIFHPFFTTKDPGKGTGLGLFIVKQIVERNEGSISVQSEVGKGTEFTLTFRLAKSETGASETAEHPAEKAAHA